MENLPQIKIQKRNGKIVDYNPVKILHAIEGANGEGKERLHSDAKIQAVYEDVLERIADYAKGHEMISIEDINDIVEDCMMFLGCNQMARRFIRYRFQHQLVREANTTDKSIKELIDGESEYWNTENSNKNSKLVTTQRDYIAGITSTDIARRFLLPKKVVEAHDAGLIHHHDMDYMAQKALHNCELINLDDCLQNGTVVNGVKINKPHRLLTATTIASQIITAVSSSSYGGATITLTHLAPFVRDSYNWYVKKYTDLGLDEEQVKKFAEIDIKKEVVDAVQTFNYQVNSMSTTNGQAPFLSVAMYISENPEYEYETTLLIEEMLKQRIKGMQNEKGVWITPAFPKLLYFIDDNNCDENSKYWSLTKLAAECSAKRLVPDYISVKKMREYKINKYGEGDSYPCMGCRSFLTPDRIKGNPAKALNYIEGKPKYYGRFNCGVDTVNLVDAALSSGKDFEKFWDILNERCELCHEGLKVRIKRLLNVTSDVAPILWKHGALARLDPGESLFNLVHGGYATASLGYAGLYECVKYMTGESHTQDAGKAFGLRVMQFLNDKCAEWKKEEDIDYSLYGSPIESTTYKFAKNLKKRFGDDVFVQIDGRDRDYITNSYHVPVFEEIDAFEKLEKESEFQKLSPGGAISYVETPNLSNNIEAVLEIIKFIYDHIVYAEINTKSDYCQVCGFDGEMQIADDMDWYCPNCGNRDHDKLNIARRTCGYIGTNFWNKGRTNEIKERVLHLDNKDVKECN